MRLERNALLPKCEQCGREFATQAALTQHTKDKHLQDSRRAPSGQGEAPSASAKKQKQKSLRKRNRHPVLIGLVIVTIVVGVGLYEIVSPSLAAPPFPCGTSETYIHVHPYLRIQIEGQNLAIPSQIGFLQGGTCLEPMHTHDSSGIIHVELPQAQSSLNFTLIDFFKVWAATSSTITFNGGSHPVVLTATDIIGYQNDATHHVVIKIDNVTVADPSQVFLERLDYCNATNSSTSSSPCYLTAQGNPYWDGTSNYPFGTSHTIVIEYVST